MRKSSKEFNDSELAYLDYHFLGTYTRNINTTCNQLDITPNGANGNKIVIKY
jgi:hypothetical protein